MATVTITIPDPQVPRVREAWDATFTRLQGESDGAFFVRILAAYTKRVVVHYEGQRDGASSKQTAESNAEAQVTIS